MEANSGGPGLTVLGAFLLLVATDSAAVSMNNWTNDNPASHERNWRKVHRTLRLRSLARSFLANVEFQSSEGIGLLIADLHILQFPTSLHFLHATHREFLQQPVCRIVRL